MNNELPDGSIDWIESAEESMAQKTESIEDPEYDPKDDGSAFWFVPAYGKDNIENSIAVPE